MEAAKPALDSTITNNYNYWQQYISDNSSKPRLSVLRDGLRDLRPRCEAVQQLAPFTRRCRSIVPIARYHTESTDGGTFNFPPREMPTHCSRRSIISALQVIKDRNQSVSDPNQQDWVSIVTFDLKTDVVIAKHFGQQLRCRHAELAPRFRLAATALSARRPRPG